MTPESHMAYPAKTTLKPRNKTFVLSIWGLRKTTWSSDKFEHLRYSHRGYPPNGIICQADNDRQIEVKSSLRDLGVTMCDDALISTYIREKVSAMKLKVGWVIRTFKRRDKYLMLTLWKQLILTDHDYWQLRLLTTMESPQSWWHIQSLEIVQRSFLSKISGMHHLSYWDQLKELRLYSLERRRERYIAIYIWRIHEGSAPNIRDSHGISFKWHHRRGRVCTVPPIPSSAPARVQTIRFASFAVKGPRIFNSLPRSLRNFTGGNVDAFKHRLDT